MALVTVFGGTGFLGSRIVDRLLRSGNTVRVGVRRTQRVRTGALPFAADIRDATTVSAAVAGAEGVVNAVSAYVEKADVTYASVHVEGALNVATACARQKVSRLVHLSGIGADPASASSYIRARGQGERKVRQAFPHVTVLRPSVMFARDDGFLNALIALAKASPVIPLIGGGRTRLQPVHADDVAEAACAALRDAAAGGATYELAGPASVTLQDVIRMILAHTGHRRVLVPVPFSVADLLARALQRLPDAPLTVAQVELLKADNVPAQGALGLAELGIVPRRIEDVIATLAPD